MTDGFTRRAWIQQLASASLLAAADAPRPKIRRIDVYPVRYPVVGHFRFFPKPERPAVVVRITAEDGAAGWGQSVPVPTWSYETLESVYHSLRHYLAPALIGRDPFDLAGAHQAMNKAIAPSFSTGMPIAKAGLDLALHDLMGRLAAKRVTDLWERKPAAQVTLSWTVNPRTMEEADQILKDGWQRGFRNFNIKVAPDPDFDVKLARKVRDFAPKGFLWADANGGYDPAVAIKAVPRLKDAGVDVLEQPVAANRLTAFRDIRKLGALPILMDEGVVSSVELAEFIELGLCDGVAMKPARTAGLWDARKQVEMVLNRGLMFLGSGLTDPDISLAASLQLYSAYGLKYPAALNGPQFLTGSLLRTPIEVKDGAAVVPSGKGLGVEIDEAKLESMLMKEVIA